jgi:GT2 family glycosyltransferase
MTNTQAPDVSVIIVNWNTKELLLDCIESLINESRRCKIEIIVVDNHSNDGSAEAVMKRFPDVMVIVNEENLGFSQANNIGIAHSTGRYICLVNTDIKVLDRALDKMHEYMEQNTQTGILTPKCLTGKMELSRGCREFPTIRNLFCEALFLDLIFPKIKLFRGRALPLSFYAATNPTNSLPCFFSIVRREALDEVGLLDTRFFFYGEDIDWCKRFHNAGWHVMYLAAARVIHYGGLSTDAAPVRFLIEKVKARLQYWEKHHGFFSCLGFKIIAIMHYAVRLIGFSLLFIVKPSSRSISGKKFNGCLASIKWIITNRGRKSVSL